MDEAGFSEVVDSVYDAAASYELWPVAMDRLAQAFNCSCVSLLERDLSTMNGRATAWGVDSESQREFLDIWAKNNILVQRTRSWRTGQIDTDLDLMPKADLLASDYYNGFMKPRDMHALLRLTLHAGTGTERNGNAVLSLVRPMSAGDYDSADVQQLRHFAPHLRRAFEIASRLEETQTMLDGITDMLEHNPAGILLLDRTGKIVLANRAVRAMARAADGFVLKGEGIVATDSRDQAALRSVIACAIMRSPPVDAVRGGAVRLSRKSGGPAFNAVVGPLGRATSWRDAGPVAFVLVTDPRETPAAPARTLAQLFGFSPTEVRVAERMMMGDSSEQMAEALNIRISTARWHLASLYRKTGTSRQAELVRLLSSLPSVC